MGVSALTLSAPSGMLKGTLIIALLFCLAAAFLEVGDVDNDEKGDGDEREDAADKKEARVLSKLEFEWHINYALSTLKGQTPVCPCLVVTNQNKSYSQIFGANDGKTPPFSSQ